MYKEIHEKHEEHEECMKNVKAVVRLQDNLPENHSIHYLKNRKSMAGNTWPST